MRLTRTQILLMALVASVTCQSALAVDIFGKKKQEEQAPAAQKDIVADVGGIPITRDQLADELIDLYGQRQLEMMIHRAVIVNACKDRKIEVTSQEVEAEIADTLKKLNVSKKEFQERILAKQGMSYPEYLRNTIWPALALKKLVDGKVTVTDVDLKKSFDANYGEKVEVRMLVVREQRKATEFWDQLDKVKDSEKRLEMFEELCKTYSIDEATRPYAGKAIVHRYTGAPELEKLAFAAKPGDITKIMQVPNGNLIMLCVDRIPANTEITLDTVANETTKETVRDMLHQDLLDKMTRVEIAKLFEEISKNTPVQNYLSGNFDIDAVKKPNAN